MRWWPRNLKHHELNQFYHEYDWPKIWYTTYLWRVLKYWYTKEIAINKYAKLLWNHLIKSPVDDRGRICVKCNEYKTWSEFARSVTWHKWHTSSCKQCRNAYKKEYRDQTNSETDKLYKKKSRTLEIWQYIHFWIEYQHWYAMSVEYRKVVDKKKMQAYKLQSMTTWYFCRLDPIEWNRNYKKFYHVDNLTISKILKTQ